MTSTNNLNEPIPVGTNDGAHWQTQEQSPLSPRNDPHSIHPTEPFPSIDIAVSAEPSPPGVTKSFPNVQEDASLNLDFQCIWEESWEGVGSTGTPHKKAAVLVVSWAEELDELDTGPEVKELADTFRKCFRYDVVEVELNAKTLPQYQLMEHLAKFMGAFDSEGTLLIVYYAGTYLNSNIEAHANLGPGHGLPGLPGELYFAR